MPKAYSYVRFSTPDQAKGDSLRRQLERSRRFAEERGLELDDSLRDLGTSAFHNRHAETGHLAGFLALAHDGKIDPGSYLLAESLDRLSRDEILPAFDLIRSIIGAQINLVILTAGDDPREYSHASITKNPSLLNEIIVDLSRSNRESRIKSERCAEAANQQRVAARAGKVKIPGRCPAWLQPIRREVGGKLATVGFDLLPEPAAAIQRVFELSLSGLGERAIATVLNREAVPGLTPGAGWHHSTVKHVLRSPAVIGTKQPGRMVGGQSVPEGEALLDYYPRVVDEGTFWRAQAARRARKQGAAGRKGPSFANLFSGLARCGECGAALLYFDKGVRADTSGRYIMCTNARRRFRCTNTAHHHYAPLEANILRALSLFDPAQLLDRPPADAHRGAELEAEIDAKRARLRQLAQYEDLAEIGSVIRKLSDDLKILQQELADHQQHAKVAEAEASRDAHAEFLALIRRMDAGEMPAPDAYLLRSRIAQHLRKVVEVIEARGEDVTVKLRAPAGGRRIHLSLARGDVRSIGFSPADTEVVDLAADMISGALRKMGVRVIEADAGDQEIARLAAERAQRAAVDRAEALRIVADDDEAGAAAAYLK